VARGRTAAVDVFVYGTLTDPAVAERVLESYSFRGAAGLEGLHVVEGWYPTLAPGGRADGRLLRTDGVAALDGYEGVDRGLYVRVSVPLFDGTGTVNPGGTVEAYVGDPDRLGADVRWPGTGGFRERVRAYLARNGVRVRRS